MPLVTYSVVSRRAMLGNKPFYVGVWFKNRGFDRYPPSSSIPDDINVVESWRGLAFRSVEDIYDSSTLEILGLVKFDDILLDLDKKRVPLEICRGRKDWLNKGVTHSVSFRIMKTDPSGPDNPSYNMKRVVFCVWSPQLSEESIRAGLTDKIWVWVVQDDDGQDITYSYQTIPGTIFFRFNSNCQGTNGV